ncbi:MAG: PocR ligand-binding domain-containing protein, partial [Anaerolineales bacterium]|nr:PocR ligand-binding domain-containing protein [Anaerolineales bacterium]
DQTERQPHLERCHAGLTYARGRVVVQDQPLAMFFVGQFAIDSAGSLRNQVHLIKLAEACQVDHKALKNGAAGIRVLSRKHAVRLLDLLQMVARTYSHIGQERLELLNRLKRVAEIAGVTTQ